MMLHDLETFGRVLLAQAESGDHFLVTRGAIAFLGAAILVGGVVARIVRGDTRTAVAVDNQSKQLAELTKAAHIAGEKTANALQDLGKSLARTNERVARLEARLEARAERQEDRP